MSVTLEPAYTHAETETTDESGVTTKRGSDILTQNYRLALDRPLTQALQLSLGGTYLDQRGWIVTDGRSTDGHGYATSLYGRLTVATPALSWGVGADRNEQRAFPSAASGFVTESYTGYAIWRPIALPELDLHLSHVNAYNTRRSQDTTTNTAILSARYETGKNDLRFVLDWNDTLDNVTDSRTTAINQTAFATRSDTVFRGRTSYYLSGTFSANNASNATRGAGFVTKQQIAIRGLSGIEAPPLTAEDIQLATNTELIDGSKTASANVNVGFRPSAANDRVPRDVGVELLDAITDVNTIYVYFDQPLKPEVANALGVDVRAFFSDDNERWTELTGIPLPVPSPFENRLEITIPKVAHKFLKVSLVPLELGVTTDLAYRDLNITEVQVLLVLPAALVPRHQSSVAGTFNGTARTIILRAPDLTYDLGLNLARNSELDHTTYVLTNGLTFGHRLWTHTSTAARVARTDQDSGRGHEGLWQWSAALIGTPLPTARWSLTYSGRANTQKVVDTSSLDPGAEPIYIDETTISNALSAMGRADWYDGISTQANATVSLTTRAERETRSVQASGTASLTPNTLVTVSLGVLYSRSAVTVSGFQLPASEFARVDASVSLTPAPALSASGTVSRIVVGDRPTTLASVQANYFPLRGELQLSLTYSKTLDTAAETTTEIFSPSLRWNLQRGVALTSTYTYFDDRSPARTLTSRVLHNTLLITF